MTLFDLVAKLTLDSSEYEEGISSAGKTASSFASKIGQGIGTAAKVGAAAVTAVATAAVAVGTAMTKAVSETAAYGDTIDKMSQKMNLSISAYQEWDAVMQHCGTSIESLQSSMKTLANAAENNNEAFERLGISQEQIANMSNEELFSATISALQGVESETERTYLAGKLLGRGATELGPLLNMTAEETQGLKDRVHELGGVMSDEAVKAAATYQDSMQDMKTAFSGVSRGLVSELLPSWTKVIDGLTEIFAGNTDKGAQMVSDGVDAAIKQIDKLLPKVTNVAEKLLNGLGKAFQKNLPKILKSGADIVGKLVSGLVKGLPSVLNTGAQAISEFVRGMVEGIPAAVPEIVGVILDIVDALTDPANLLSLLDAGLEIITALAEGIINSLPELLDRLPGIIDNIVTVIVEGLPKIVEAAGEILSALVSYFLDPANQNQILEAGAKIVASIIDGIGSALWNLAEVAATILDTLAADVAEALGLGQIYESGKGALAEFVRGLRDDLGTKFPALASDIGAELSSDLTSAENLRDVYEAGVKAFRSFITGIRDSMPELWEVLKGLFTLTGAGGALSAFETLESGIEEGGTSAFGSAATKIAENAAGPMSEAGEEAADLLLDSFKAKGIDSSMLAAGELPPAFSGAFEQHFGEFEADGQAAGEAVGNGLVSGVNASTSAAVQAATDLANSIIQTFKDKLQISSPSKITRGFGRNVSEGFGLGIVDELGEVTEAATKAVDAAAEAFDRSIDGDYIFGSISKKDSNFAQAGAWGDVTDLLREIRDKPIGPVVLDTGLVVGYMDEALGALSVRKARGGAFA